MNISAKTAVRAQQGAFLKISGDSSLSKYETTQSAPATFNCRGNIADR